MIDLGHDMTEEMLETLEKRIAAMYGEASKDLDALIQEYFDNFKVRDAQQKALLEAGEITEQQYRLWRMNQIGRGERYESLRDELAERMYEANEIAAAYINDATPGVYSLNRNYAAYTIERVHGNVGFTLFDEETVRRLLVENPDLMPHYPANRAIARAIDLAYSKEQITAMITSGILQGKSIDKIATDLMDRLDAMDRISATRAARTAMTSAQNAGRMDSYLRAAEMGIKVRKRWIATKDMRTRHSHGALDGQTVAVDEPFVSVLGSKMMFPGDREGGKPADLYNCRCTMRTVEKEGLEAESRQMRVRNPETGQNELINEMTYAEWAGWKEKRKAMDEKPLYDIMGVSKNNIDISSLPTETQKLVEDSVRRSVEKFPQLKGHFTKIEYDESIEAIASSKSITGSVKLSKKFKDYQKLQKDYDYDVRMGWHPKGTTAQSTITHEIGHQLDGLLTKKGIYGGSVSQYGVTRTSVAVQKEVLTQIGLSDEKLREIRKQYSDMGYKGKDLNHAVQFERKEFIEKHICSYAAENSNEFFACLYAEYMDSPEPREAAKVFGEILERIIGEIK